MTNKTQNNYMHGKNMLKGFSLSIVSISGIVTDATVPMADKREGTLEK